MPDPNPLTLEERDLIGRMIEHMGCNCGDWECFSDADTQLAVSITAKLAPTSCPEGA